MKYFLSFVAMVALFVGSAGCGVVQTGTTEYNELVG
jgi:hypothetical protein